MRPFLILLSVTTLMPAQDTIRSQSRLVQVWATVEGTGELTAEDFQLRVDGKPQRIESVDTFSTGVAPVSLVVAVETAGISATSLLVREFEVRVISTYVACTGKGGTVASSQTMRSLDQMYSTYVFPSSPLYSFTAQP